MVLLEQVHPLLTDRPLRQPRPQPLGRREVSPQAVDRGGEAALETHRVAFENRSVSLMISSYLQSTCRDTTGLFRCSLATITCRARTLFIRISRSFGVEGSSSHSSTTC